MGLSGNMKLLFGWDILQWISVLSEAIEDGEERRVESYLYKDILRVHSEIPNSCFWFVIAALVVGQQAGGTEERQSEN